jgi:hypothetical protein
MSGKKKYENVLTREFLLKEYVENKKSCSQISRETKTSICSVIEYLKTHGIEQRIRGLSPGTKCGKLTLIEIDGVYKNGSYFWKCLCDCGGYVRVLTAQLKNGRTKTCGCAQKMCGKNHAGWTGFGDIGGAKWGLIKRKAFHRKIDFNISIEQAWELFEKQDGKCYLSGKNLCFYKKTRDASYGTASLDRINSSIGYEVGNVGWVHKDLNSMKHIFSVEEFIHYCGLISNFDGIFNPSTHDFITHKDFINTAKARYKKRNLTFNLTGEQIVQKFNNQGGVCALTGLTLIFPDSNSNFEKFNHTASLDRIDNNMGYSFDNVQFVHKLINKSRKNLTIEKYKELCKTVYLYNLNKIPKELRPANEKNH